MKNLSTWAAKWIWSTADPVTVTEGNHKVVYFRKFFTVYDPLNIKFTAHISAASRYRLFLNGVSVSSGPSKGDRFVHYYDTVDLSEYVVEGENLLTVKVVHYTPYEPFKLGIGGPASIWRTMKGGFIFEGQIASRNDNATINLCSDESWECLKDEAIQFLPGVQDTLYVGGPEQVDGRNLPHGWLIGQDGADWKPSAVVSDVLDTEFGQIMPWRLYPRTTPPMKEQLCGFIKLMQSNRVVDEAAIIRWHDQADFEGWIVQPGERLEVELDAGELVTAFVAIAISGGTNARISLLTSECYEKEPESTIRRNKNIRDNPQGQMLFGETDIYIAAGVGLKGDHRTLEIYEPFEFRTFRFIRLTIEAKDEELRLHRVHFRNTGYPLEIKAYFESSDQSLSPLWDISVRTLLRCMHETYEDCPFYEQMQYVMDTKLQALYTYQLGADDRLARKAIYDFHCSQLPEGLVQSRYPSVYPQVIPGFSLYWIMMVSDHYHFFGDLKLVRSYAATIDSILSWFDGKLTDGGLVDQMPPDVWSFVDWVEEWRESRGVPIANEFGPLTVMSMIYAYALTLAADLNEHIGRSSTADEYNNRAFQIKRAVRRYCWSEEKKMFADGPGLSLFSQHAQIWAVLSGIAGPDEAGALMDRMLADSTLPKASYAMSFFLFRSLEKAGRYERAFEMWDTWRKLVNMKLTTWVEDPVSQRSDCHGWGAVPIYEFSTQILGVQSGAPGFSSIIIKPQPGPLKWANGAVATPKGEVHVAWKLEQNGDFTISMNSPAGVPVQIALPDGTTYECSQGGRWQSSLKQYKTQAEQT